MDSDQSRVKYVPFEEHSISDNQLKWILTHVIGKVDHDEREGIRSADLSGYDKLNLRVDVEEIVTGISMRRIYVELGSKVKSVPSVSFMEFYDRHLSGNLPVSDSVTAAACLNLDGRGVVNAYSNGVVSPRVLNRGDIFMWDPRKASVSLDRIDLGTKVMVYGLI